MTGALKQIIANPKVQLMAAKAAVKWAPRLKFGKTLVLSRWSDVNEVLARDLDFLIAPVNQERIERVNGPFVLGLDRSTNHLHEREVLYKALSPEDIPRIRKVALAQATQLLDAVQAGDTIDVVNHYARRVASRSATALMGVEGPSEEDQMRVARAMFHELFLNLGGDQEVRAKAVNAAAELRAWVGENIADKRRNRRGEKNMLARLIALGGDDDLIRRTVSGMFVGAIDTTATCVAQIMDVIVHRPNLKLQIMRDLENEEKMRSWCYEALRFRPHNPIVLRQAMQDCYLGETQIKAGTRVVCFTLAAMHDPSAFPQPEKAMANRPEAFYLHFGGGLHPCAGRAINGVQIPLLVSQLLRRDPVPVKGMKHDGPFPDELTLRLQS